MTPWFDVPVTVAEKSRDEHVRTFASPGVTETLIGAGPEEQERARTGRRRNVVLGIRRCMFAYRRLWEPRPERQLMGSVTWRNDPYVRSRGYGLQQRKPTEYDIVERG